ncbi:hypothetical protein SH528x_001710 [Novipirellula sp. SH528]|uniref:hypothetical protein n=1 Tax=Novipirellula sp. SH528 TaxID=3454466 RepID=UPI003F9F4019
MVAFFVKTEQASAGPFTGVELREAALSGIIGPNSMVGDTETGPWHPALAIGLFSEKRIALPHPDGTVVPSYHVRGMLGSAQGPFKLRELIGFAARGMLPPDAEIQSNVTQTWIRVDRIHVLKACLTGELVLLGSEGTVHRRTDAGTPRFVGNRASTSSLCSAAVAPATVAKSISPGSAEGMGYAERDFRSDNRDTQCAESEVETPARADSQTTAARDDRETETARYPFLFRLLTLASAVLARVGLLARSRLAIGAIVVLTAVGAASMVMSGYRAAAMPRERVIGDWVQVGSENGETHSLAISFRPDATCVIFDTHGDSWTGDFSWTERVEDSHGFSSIDGIEAIYDTIAADHLHAPVKPTDGHIRLQGMMSEPPTIAGHSIRDCFLRRDGESLLLGYLTSVHWSVDQKTMQAGWIRLQPFASPEKRSVAENLKSIPAETRPSDIARASEPDFPISEAIVSIEKVAPGPRDRRFASDRGRLTYSNLVDAEYLLRTFGIPDAARPLFPFEAPRLRSGPSFEASHLIRYGTFKFLLNSEGQLQYISKMK